jgi:hypothetical protein
VVLVNEPSQHYVQVFHHLVEVEHDRLHRLFAAEDKQLPRQPGRAEQAIELVGGKDTKIEGITVVDTLKAGAANP